MGLPKEHFDFVRENTRDEAGIPAMAITNHGHMNSFCHAYLYAKELNRAGKPFKFLPGVEAYVHPDLEEWRRTKAAKELEADVDENIEHGGTVENEEESKTTKFYDPIKRRHHLVVLAKSSRGLEKLFGLVSRGYLEGFYKFPRIDYRMLKEHRGEFVVSTACVGGPLAYSTFSSFPDAKFDELVPSLVDDPNVRERVLSRVLDDIDRIVDAVGRENFFLELQFNRLGAQHLVNRMLIEAHRRTGIPLIVTADSHYCRPEVWREREIYKKLGWMNYSSYDASLLPQGIDELKAELYPKNAQQIWESYRQTTAGMGFYDDQLVCDAVERTHDIAFQMIGDVQPDTSVKLPSWSVPKGKTAPEALAEACDEGMRRMGLDGRGDYVGRLKYELGVIAEKRFDEYFLTMKAITDIAAERMLIGCGRGSAAGSLVNYVLGITQVDPLKYGLIFERFINPLREEFPDIDSDFADRDLLIDLLKARFGETNVVPISNYNTFQLKSLVKDVSRFFHRDDDDDGLDFQTVNGILGPLDDEVRKRVLKQGDDKNLFELKLEDCLEHSPSFRGFMEEHPEVARPIKTLLHENKSLGKHASGVIVSERVPERMPVIMSRKEPQVPFSEGMHYKHLNELGWIKFDILGLETLRIIQRCIELILQRHEGVARPTFDDVKGWYQGHLHPDVIDLDDPRVYEHVYCSGRWAGVFQFTAKGAQQFCVRAQPKNIIDIAAITSIYRPGPLVAGVDRDYVQAKENPDDVVYEHPLIKEVLGKTFGFLVFQEQMLRLGNIVGKMPLAKCDRLRKVITKRTASGKDKAATEAEKLGEEFIAGAIENGFTERKAVELWDSMAAFKGYAFNLSHALSYAIDSYMCAWLLTYYEPEWLCAYMETQAGQPEKRAYAIKELKGFGYDIAPVDINHASGRWTIIDGEQTLEDGTVVPMKRFMPSFLTIKGMGAKAVEEVERHRPYRTLHDLLWEDDGSWKHSKFNKRALESLVRVGGFESMGLVGPGRTFSSYRQMHAVVIEGQRYLKHRKKGRDELRRLLVETSGLEEWPRSELIRMSKEIVGSADLNLVITQRLRDRLETMGIPSVDDFASKGIHWFIVDEAVPKVSKNGKPYLLLAIVGPSGKGHRCYAWGWDPQKHGIVEPNWAYMSVIDASQYGFSLKIWEMKQLREVQAPVGGSRVVPPAIAPSEDVPDAG